MTFLLTAAISYLLGSIPFGYILVRIFRGQDIRQSGSGNIGATNVARSSLALGALTLVLDGMKGFAAVALTTQYFLHAGLTMLDFRLHTLRALAALCAILGHMFPLWLGYRGGKGVATALGGLLPLVPFAILAALALFVALALGFRYVSLGSVISAASVPGFAWLFYDEHFGRSAFILVCIASAVVIARHHQNIGRLLARTEPRFQLRRG
jgi:glycerol-3-phosphate acyltransferase PlsY